MKMMRRFALLLLFVLVGSFVASAQLKTLTLGRLTYIGESPDGTSFFTVTLDTNTLGKTTVPLASPITFVSFTTAIVGQTGSVGPFVDTTDRFTTPTEVAFTTNNVQQGGHPETITTSSTVNVFLTALPGQQTIQLQQFAYINLKAVQ